MSGLDNGVKRDRLILGILFIAASVAFIVAIHMTGALAEVVKIYFPYADSLFNGVIPDMEYPPFALVFIALPRLFAATEMGYLIVFVAEVAVFFIIGLIVTGKLAKRYNFSQHMAMLIYTILMLLMFEFVVDRFDIFPAILTLLSFYCLVTKRYVWAFALLSIATMTKLYPAVLFPIYLIPLIYNRDWMNALKGAGVFILVAALTILPFILAGSLESATYFLTYHMDRPIQIESTASSIIFLFQALGLTNVDIVFSYGSDNIVGPWPDAVAPFLTPLMIAAVVAVYAMYAYMLVSLRRDGKDNENNRMILLGSAALLSIMAFMIFGKVFSSQYPIWIIPPSSS